jgi:predicted nuclease of restriction endonuclease-like RecB superfamily
VLPSELARFRLSKGRILPLFAGEEEEELASSLISLFREGSKLGDVLRDAEELEKVYDYRLVRGMTTLLVRRCELDPVSPVDPSSIRRELFSYGPVFSEDQRSKILEEIKDKFGVDPEGVGWSDLEEARTIRSFRSLTPEELVGLYNLSLLQTMMFRTYRVQFHVSSKWKEILRKAKLMGLMYDAFSEPKVIEVYGPSSLLKLTTKYGRNVALLVPDVVSSPNWKIEAEVVIGKRVKRIYKLSVENGVRILIPQQEGIQFDSSVEERFFEDFRRNPYGWSIQREPGPIIVGGRIFLPDFLVSKGGIKIYVEIVGFWTRDYIRAKLEKLSKVKEPFLVILNEEIARPEFKDFNVITYRKRVDVSSVLNWLRKYETEKLKDLRLEGLLRAEVETVPQVAARLGLSADALRGKKVKGYLSLPDYFVREDLVERLKGEDFEGKTLSEVVSKYGNFVPQLLPLLGYDIVWRNIDPRSALIVRRR